MAVAPARWPPGYSSSGRAPALGAGGVRFESSCPDEGIQIRSRPTTWTVEATRDAGCKYLSHERSGWVKLCTQGDSDTTHPYLGSECVAHGFMNPWRGSMMKQDRVRFLGTHDGTRLGYG